MAGYPNPEPGLVISYSYLWSDEAAEGRVEGRKDRPCAIVLAREEPSDDPEKPRQVAVVPITHSPPIDPNVAIEIPPAVKQHLGLDSERSWVVCDEVNTFRWPGYDLRPVRKGSDRYDHGSLPPKLFQQIIDRIAELHEGNAVVQTSRDDPEISPG